jgi:hypothetical protein
MTTQSLLRYINNLESIAAYNRALNFLNLFDSKIQTSGFDAYAALRNLI